MQRNLGMRLLLVALAAMLALSACGPEQENPEKPGDQLSLYLGPEPASIDPALVEERAAAQVAELLFLGLTDLDDRTLEAIPELATRWEVSADGLTWRFFLRKDVRWVRYIQGRFVTKRAVTAHDIEYAVLRALTARNALPGAELLFILRNGRAFYDGELSDPAAVGVRAVADDEIVFALERPAAYFPVLAGLPPFRPLPKEALEQAGERWTEPENVWTNGPFSLSSWEHGAALTLLRNPHYPEARSVAIQQVNLTLGDDEEAAFALYEEDKLDVCPVPQSKVAEVQADGRLARELQLVPDLGTEVYGLNTSRPPFDQAEVRRAFSLAIDRAALVQTVLAGQGAPARSLGAPGAADSPANDEAFKGIGFDAEQARKLLAAAGYAGGKGLPAIVLAVNDDPQAQAVAEFVQQSWQQVLGAEVKVESRPWVEHYSAVAGDAPPVFRIPAPAGYPSESAWLREVMLAPTGASALQWRNADYDSLLIEAGRTNEAAQRRALYARAEELLCVEDAALIPLYHPARFVASKPWVERTPSPLGVEHIERWKINPQ